MSSGNSLYPLANHFSAILENVENDSSTLDSQPNKPFKTILNSQNASEVSETTVKATTKFNEIFPNTTNSENKLTTQVSVFPPVGFYPTLQENLPLILPQKSDSFTLDSPLSGSPSSASPKKSILKTSPHYSPKTASPLTTQETSNRVQFLGPNITIETIIQENKLKQELYSKLKKEIYTINQFLFQIILYNAFTSQGFITQSGSPSPFASFTKLISTQIPEYCNRELEHLNSSTPSKNSKESDSLKKLRTVTQTLFSQQTTALTPKALSFILKKRLTKISATLKKINQKLHYKPHIGELLSDLTNVQDLEAILIKRVNVIFQDKVFSSVDGTRRPRSNPNHVRDVSSDLIQYLDSFGRYLTKCVFLSWMDESRLFAFYKKAPNIAMLEIQEYFTHPLPDISTHLRYRKLDAFKKLTELHLNTNHLPTECFLKIISSYCTQLTKITIRFTGYNINEMPIALISGCSHLQSLSLCGNIPLSQDHIQTLTQCVTLRIFEIIENHDITDEELLGLEKLCPQLNTLVLRSCSLVGAKPFAKFNFKILDTAEFSQCRAIRSGIIAIVGKIESLRILKLVSNKMLSGIDFENLRPAKSLQKLTIGFNDRLSCKGFNQFLDLSGLTHLVMPRTGLPFEPDSLLATACWKKLNDRHTACNPLKIELYNYEEPHSEHRVIFSYLPERTAGSGDDSSEGASTGDDSDPEELVDRNHPKYLSKWSFTAGGSREV